MVAIHVFSHDFYFLMYYHVKIQIIVSNMGCKVFQCTENFTLKHDVSLIVKCISKY